jgi:hypothetical protein
MSTSEVGTATALAGVVVVPSTVSHEVMETAQRLGVVRYLPEVIAFTAEIFDGISDVRVDPDPELPEEVFIIFEVPVTGSVGDILDKERKWSRRLLQAVPRAPRPFSLAMDYRS